VKWSATLPRWCRNVIREMDKTIATQPASQPNNISFCQTNDGNFTIMIYGLTPHGFSLRHSEQRAILIFDISFPYLHHRSS
jgi:hypothetical protein